MNSKDPRVRTLNPKIGGPIALVLVIGFAALFIYGYMKQKNAEMQLVDIKGDEVLVEKGNFTVRNKNELHDKEWTFLPAMWMKASELRRMYDAEEIIGIVRPKGEN